jgi:hypothetical protein
MSVLDNFLMDIPYWTEQLNQLPIKTQEQQYKLTHLDQFQQGASLPSESVTDEESAEPLETEEEGGAAMTNITQHPFSPKDDPSYHNVSLQQTTTSSRAHHCLIHKPPHTGASVPTQVSSGGPPKNAHAPRTISTMMKPHKCSA